jgi:hypothetical protein
MVLIAVGNGVLREALLRPRLGELRARQLSTLLLLGFFAVYFAVVFHLWPLASAYDAVIVGCAWLLLTLAFELGLGRLVSRLPWRDILAEYNLLAGRLASRFGDGARIPEKQPWRPSTRRQRASGNCIAARGRS